VQVNGRLRGHLRMPADAPEAEIVARARADEKVAAHLEGRMVRKTIYLPGAPQHRRAVRRGLDHPAPREAANGAAIMPPMSPVPRAPRFRSDHARGARAFVLAVLVTALAGCGYHLAGHGSTLPPAITAIGSRCSGLSAPCRPQVFLFTRPIPS